MQWQWPSVALSQKLRARIRHSRGSSFLNPTQHNPSFHQPIISWICPEGFHQETPRHPIFIFVERLSVLNLESLEVRCVKIDLVICFKILKGLTRITPSEFFTLSCGPTRGHSLKLYCPDSRINIRAHFFTVRVIKVWNKLPPTVM